MSALCLPISDYVQKEVLHQQKDGRISFPSMKGAESSPLPDQHQNWNHARDVSPPFNHPIGILNKPIEDINESAEFRSSCNPTEYPQSKDGKL